MGLHKNTALTLKAVWELYPPCKASTEQTTVLFLTLPLQSGLSYSRAQWNWKTERHSPVSHDFTCYLTSETPLHATPALDTVCIEYNLLAEFLLCVARNKTWHVVLHLWLILKVLLSASRGLTSKGTELEDLDKPSLPPQELVTQYNSPTHTQQISTEHVNDIPENWASGFTNNPFSFYCTIQWA